MTDASLHIASLAWRHLLRHLGVVLIATSTLYGPNPLFDVDDQRGLTFGAVVVAAVMAVSAAVWAWLEGLVETLYFVAVIGLAAAVVLFVGNLLPIPENWTATEGGAIGYVAANVVLATVVTVPLDVALRNRRRRQMQAERTAAEDYLSAHDSEPDDVEDDEAYLPDVEPAGGYGGIGPYGQGGVPSSAGSSAWSQQGPSQAGMPKTEAVRAALYERASADAEEQVRRHLPLNPRSAKRVLNHLRLALLIAQARGVFDDQLVSRDHLSKWVLLSEQWPALGAALARDPGAMDALEAAAGLDELRGALGDVAPTVPASPELLTLLNGSPELAPVLDRLVRL